MNTMNHFFSQLKKESREIRLTREEREHIRCTLYSAMEGYEKNPIRVMPSPLFFFSPRIVFSLALVLVLAVVGGGTVYAAESAVPGDALYAVKVGLNEPVRAALAFSSEEKIAVHARFAERRIEEAEILAVRGALTSERKTTLEESFEMHTTEAEAAILEIEQEDPVIAVDASSRFGSRIEAHSAILSKLRSEIEDEESRRESGNLARSLRERRGNFAKASEIAVLAAREASMEARSTFAERVPTTPALSPTPMDPESAVIARIELSASTTLDEAEVLLNALRANLNASTTARVKEQIGKTRNSLKIIQIGAETSSHKEKAKKALQDAATLHVFIEAQEKFQGRALLPAPGVGENGDDSLNGEDQEEERHE